MRTLSSILLAISLMLPATASAHPMSRDKWSLRTALQLAGDKMDAIVVLEVPFDVVTADLKDALAAAREAENPSRSAQAVLDNYAKKHWSQLGAGMSLTVDGEAVAGAWQPRDNRLNGKGAVTGGFFMYIVEFVPAAALPLDEDVTLKVVNEGYTDPKMVYSAMVMAGDGWEVVSNSSLSALPDRPYDLNDQAFWVDDASLRTLEARYTKKP